MLRLLAAAALLLILSTPAHACKCAPDETRADAVLADPAISVADVTVRGFNTRNGQSMLQIDNIRHCSLVARDIRAKFAAHSCGVVPNQKKMTLLIRNESDGTYAIVGECDHSAVMRKLKVQ